MNYWKAVLAALLLSLLAGSGSSAFSGSGLSVFSGGITSGAASYSPVPPVMVLMLAGMFTVIILIVAAIAIAVDILLINPLEVGIRRFFTRNLYEKAQIRELAFGFDHSYKNVIHVMFFRDLHIFLWSLLFIIPGIVKSYEYRMIPYLLADYPDMPKDDAFAISKYMMSGNKWKTFVLDLSFILWWLGSAFTLGLLGLFYGDPYMAQTGAVLYDVLKAEKQPFAPQPFAPQPGSPAGQPYPQYPECTAEQPAQAPSEMDKPAEQSAQAPSEMDKPAEQPARIPSEMDKPAEQDYNTEQE